MSNPWQLGQFVPTRFKLIESQLFLEWPGGAFKLYTYMRRFVWRSRNGKLGMFYGQGLLCVEGYLGSWAKALGVSKATISRWLDWMKREGVFWLVRDTHIIGGIQPSIYALGQVYDPVGGQSDDTIELFYSDYADQRKAQSAIEKQQWLPFEIELEDGQRFASRFSGSVLPTKQVPIIKDSRLVYFIRGANGKIKIGIAQDIVKRMRELQIGSASKLELMAISRGGIKYEKELHEQFSRAHIHGEWFEPIPELLELIGLHEEQGKNLI